MHRSLPPIVAALLAAAATAGVAMADRGHDDHHGRADAYSIGLWGDLPYNDAQKTRVENAGVLTASGLIAGEALCGIAVAAVIARKLAQNPHAEPRLFQFAIGDHLIMAVIALAVLVAAMVMVPLANAGRPEDPAPPTAIM